MSVSGILQKMKVQHTSPVSYELPLGDELVSVNQYLGQTIELKFEGKINCIACGRETKKSFNQGYCFPCIRTLAECDSCIVRPEQCHFDEGTCRDEQWAHNHCMQDHIVYLANSSGVKVGITRHTQVPIRWIDQGATQALPILKVKHRYLSGLVEVALKKHVADKTDWRKMLKGNADPVDLCVRRDELLSICKDDIKKLVEQFGEKSLYYADASESTTIEYPVEEFPEKVKSLNFDKTPSVKGLLKGIKGQYLILDIGVINMRKFAGYNVRFLVA